MVNMSDYQRGVRRSLLPREMLGGVPQAALLVIVFLSIIFLYMLRLYILAVPIVLLYIIARAISAKDEWLIDIIIENIQQKDVYIP